MARRAPERVIAVAWGGARRRRQGGRVYPVDVLVEAADRPGLLRDISEVFAKEKMNVAGVSTQAGEGRASGGRVDDLHGRGRDAQRCRAVLAPRAPGRGRARGAAALTPLDEPPKALL